MVQPAFGLGGGGPLCSVASRASCQTATASGRAHFRVYPTALARALSDGKAPRRRFAAKAEFRPAASVPSSRNLTPTNRLFVQTISQLRRTAPSFVNSRSNLCGTSAVGHAMARRAPLPDMSQTTHAKHLLGCANETTADRRIGRRWALRWSRCWV